MTGYVLAAVIWMTTGLLAWLYNYRQTDKSQFDAFMIGPCMMVGPICLIAMLRGQRR